MGFITFPKDTSPKVNVKMQLGLELTYYDVTVQYVRHRQLLPSIVSTDSSFVGAMFRYLPMSPTRQGLTQGQKPEGRLKWG